MKTQTSSYQRYRFPYAIISHAVWLYHRFCLSFREVEELLAEHGIIITYESVRQWCQKFGADYARKLRKRQGRLGDAWHIDEVFVTMIFLSNSDEIKRLRNASFVASSRGKAVSRVGSSPINSRVMTPRTAR